MGESRRVRALDGLRGIAATVVVIDHSVVLFPAMANSLAQEPVPAAWAWMTFTPVHILWAGTEAVYVFFILSGLVLVLPFLDRPMRYRSYYATRLLRLYIPVVASVALALLWSVLIPRTGLAGRGLWIEDHDRPETLLRLIGDITLVHPSVLNGPLWSLRWEVVFSALLPLYVWLVRRFRRHTWGLLTIAMAASTVGHALGEEALLYLPMFLIGGSLAALISDARLPSFPHPWIVAIVIVGITAGWTSEPIGTAVSSSLFPVVLASTAFTVVLAARQPQLRNALESPVPQWLGTKSFSIYLVHEPVLVSAAILTPLSATVLAPLIGVPIALLLAVMFSRFVEEPSHRLAKRFGGSVERMVNTKTRRGTATAPLP